MQLKIEGVDSYPVVEGETIKIIEMSKSVTVQPHNVPVFDVFDMGLIPDINGYRYIGVITAHGGYSDQWQVTFAQYTDNHVWAQIHSKWPNALSTTVRCTLLYIRV